MSRIVPRADAASCDLDLFAFKACQIREILITIISRKAVDNRKMSKVVEVRK